MGSDPRVGNGSTFADGGGLVDLRDVVSRLKGGADAVGFEVGLACAEVEPVALVGVKSGELSLGGEFEEGGDDGDFFVSRDEVENLRADAVDASELMGAF